MKISKLLRLIFLKETLLLIFGLVSLWFSIAIFVDSNYSISNLKPHKGVIVALDSVITKVKDKPFFKEITKELQLTLDSYSEVFTLSTTENFGDITSRVNMEDSVTVYTKPKLWGIFGLKKGSDINHLTKGEDIILDYKKYKDSLSGFFYFTLLFSIILFVAYIVKLRKRLWWDFDGYVKYYKKRKDA